MSTIAETPSKKAANALKEMNLNTPQKPTKLAAKFAAATGDDDDERRVEVAVTTEKEAEDDTDALPEWRRRFVGDVDIEEKDEPLLTESRRRFVLFPIQYHEVSPTSRDALIPASDALFLRSGKCTRRVSRNASRVSA